MRPDPPRNPRLVFPDGRHVPLFATYQGFKPGEGGAAGVHEWVLRVAPDDLPVVWQQVAIEPQGLAVRMDALPPHTSAHLDLVFPWPGAGSPGGE